MCFNFSSGHYPQFIYFQPAAIHIYFDAKRDKEVLTQNFWNIMCFNFSTELLPQNYLHSADCNLSQNYPSSAVCNLAQNYLLSSAASLQNFSISTDCSLLKNEFTFNILQFTFNFLSVTYHKLRSSFT